MRAPAARGAAASLSLLAVLFFLSGTSALIYQVLWLRLLGLVFGVTVYAASTVWAAFMGGLALGSLIGGRAADRAARPLVWLGIAEALIGATALATPFALETLERLYATLHPSLNSSLATLTLVRLLISFAVLIVPSALMGATLPLIVRSSLFDPRALGSRVSVLYATNTAGAIAGSLAAGLALIPRLGIRGSFLAAAALNLVVAVAALTAGVRSRFSAPAGGEGGVRSRFSASTRAESRDLTPAAGVRSRFSEAVGPPGDTAVAGSGNLMAETASPARGHPNNRDLTPAGRAIVLLVFTLSGFVSLALEVVWFRVLTLFLRPTVYGYAMMLAAVLGGIALGSYLVAPVLRRRPEADWMLTLAWLEAGIATASLLSFAVLPAIPAVMGAAGPVVAALTGDYLAYQLIVSAIVILPSMVLFGAAFPVGLHVWAPGGTGSSSSIATRIGLFYSLNVAGAIVGSLAAGFILLPRLGSLVTLQLLAAVSAISALALAGAARTSPWRRLLAAAVTAAAVLVAATLTPDPFDSFLAQRYPGQSIVWRREAVQATVSVHRERGGTYTLNVSGNHQASTSGSTPRAHHRIGNLPMVVHTDARRALVIGLGGGATAGAVSQHTGVSVDVVELSREVVQAADRFFRPINFDVVRKPNVTIHVDDGRNYLLLTGSRYDVITADVILPIHAGSGNLYSQEYFQLVRRALNPGGMVLQWVAGTESEYRLIMRTFLSVFPETTLWGDGSLMLGSTEPLRLRPADFKWKMTVPGRRAMLESFGVRTFDDLLKLYVAGPEELRRYAGEGPVLTDDRPLVEYFLSLPRDRQPDLSGVKGDVRRYVDVE